MLSSVLCIVAAVAAGVVSILIDRFRWVIASMSVLGLAGEFAILAHDDALAATTARALAAYCLAAGATILVLSVRGHGRGPGRDDGPDPVPSPSGDDVVTEPIDLWVDFDRAARTPAPVEEDR